jgi:hypothetical protein
MTKPRNAISKSTEPESASKRAPRIPSGPIPSVATLQSDTTNKPHASSVLNSTPTKSLQAKLATASPRAFNHPEESTPQSTQLGKIQRSKSPINISMRADYQKFLNKSNISIL